MKILASVTCSLMLVTVLVAWCWSYASYEVEPIELEIVKREPAKWPEPFMIGANAALEWQQVEAQMVCPYPYGTDEYAQWRDGVSYGMELATMLGWDR